MATKTKAAPKQAAPKTIGELADLIGKLPANSEYSSMAVLVRAAHPDTPKTLATQARHIFRTLDEGVGRGKRYNGVKPADWNKAYQKVQADRQRAKDTAKAEKAKAKEKATATA